MNLEEKLESVAAELAAAADRGDLSAASVSAARSTELSQRAVRELPRSQAAPQISAASRRFEAARRKICVARAKIADRFKKADRAADRTPAEIAVRPCSIRG